MISARINFEIKYSNFRSWFKRNPKDESEFKLFVRLCNKHVDAQLDWRRIFQLAKDDMNEGVQ